MQRGTKPGLNPVNSLLRGTKSTEQEAFESTLHQHVASHSPINPSKDNRFDALAAVITQREADAKAILEIVSKHKNRIKAQREAIREYFEFYDRFCFGCAKWLNIDVHFTKEQGSATGHRSYCRKCANYVWKRYHKKNRELLCKKQVDRRKRKKLEQVT